MRSLTIDARKITHSGIGRYLRNLLPGVLQRLQVDQIMLLGNEDEIAAFAALDGRCSVVSTRAAPHSLAEQWLALSPTLRTTDLLWVPHYNIPLLYRGKLVTTLHDLAPLDLPEAFDHPAKRLLATVLLRRCAARSSAILTPSHFSRDRVVARLHVPAERVHVTPLAVDPGWPTLADAPPAYISAEPYLLFVGNLKPNKNLATVLQAMQIFGQKWPLRLIVAGKVDGFRTRDNTAAHAAQALGNRVLFCGDVSDTELIALYCGAAALVMPSLYEGFGLPVLEAMRYGCPVIAASSTSLPEVAGDAATLVDPRNPVALAEAIRQVLSLAHAKSLREAGLAREHLFTYEPAIAKTADVLNHCLEFTR